MLWMQASWGQGAAGSSAGCALTLLLSVLLSICRDSGSSHHGSARLTRSYLCSSQADATGRSFGLVDGLPVDGFPGACLQGCVPVNGRSDIQVLLLWRRKGRVQSAQRYGDPFAELAFRA